MEEAPFLTKTPYAEVREEKLRGVEYPGHMNLIAAMERHPALHRENQQDGCLSCQKGTAQNPQTRWRRKQMGAHPPERLRQPPPEARPHPPGMPPMPTCDTEAAEVSDIEGVPPGYMHIHTPLPSAQRFNHDAYAKDRKRDKDFYSDLLTDKGTSTGWYTICRVVMQLTSILQTTAAYWANLPVKMSIDRIEWVLGVYYYLQLADTLKYILKDIFICIIKEQCSDKGESTWRRYKGCHNTVNDIAGQIEWYHIVDTAIAKWASTERQWFFVLDHW